MTSYSLTVFHEFLGTKEQREWNAIDAEFKKQSTLWVGDFWRRKEGGFMDVLHDTVNYCFY
jgi:hypothetical protein